MSPGEVVRRAGGRLRTVAERTPPDRERHVDLVRAAAIGLVVLGHWMVSVVVDENGLDGLNALGEVTWLHPLTWLFQVMPLFFFVGGYANAASLHAHRRRGGDGTGWIAGRFERLTRPSTVFLGVLVAGAVTARLIGVDIDDVATAVWLVTLPLWLLLAYLAVCALAPLTLHLHDRWGVAVPIALVAGVVANDVAGLALGIAAVAELNHLLVFMAFHQLGYAWQDDSLPASPRVGIPLFGFALTVLVALVATGVYPVSMVSVPGEVLDNAEPPNVALLLLGLAQIGLTLASRDRFAARLRRPRPWIAVVAVNTVVLTLFLWHFTAVLVAAIVLFGTGLVPATTAGSAPWFVLRLPWLATCAVVLAALVATFSGAERSPPRAPSGSRSTGWHQRALTASSAGLLVVGTLGIVMTGSTADGPLGVPTWSLLTYGVGSALLAGAVRHVRAPT